MLHVCGAYQLDSSPKKLGELVASFRLRFKERRRQMKRREQISPKEEPFPCSIRKRALTLPGTDHQEKQQSSCLFFNKLPLGVRRDIYEKVIGASILHIGILNKGGCARNMASVMEVESIGVLSTQWT